MTTPRKVAASGNDLLVSAGQLPESIRPAAAALSLRDEDFLFAVQSDLDMDGDPAEAWLVVTKECVVTFAAGRKEPIAGPFPIKEIEKVRVFQNVGSAALQLMVKTLFVDVVRFSNAWREVFDRARAEIERMTKGLPVDKVALTRPREWVCPKCDLPLSARGGVCPRCTAGRGILIRVLTLMEPYWSSSLLLLGMLIIRVCLSLVPPYLVKVLVDRVLKPQQNAEWLPLFVLGLLLVAVGVCIVNIVIGRASASIGTRIGKELREVLQKKLVSLDVEYYDRHSVGSLMSRVLYDVDYFQGFVNQVAQGFLLNLLTVLGIGVMLFIYELAPGAAGDAAGAAGRHRHDVPLAPHLAALLPASGTASPRWPAAQRPAQRHPAGEGVRPGGARAGAVQQVGGVHARLAMGAAGQRGHLQPDHGLRLRPGRPDHLVRRRRAGARARMPAASRWAR